MKTIDIISWIGGIVTIISFLVNIIQYFRYKEMDNKYKDIIKNVSVTMEGIRGALEKSILKIEKSTPPPQIDTAIASLKGSVKAEVENITAWLENYGYKVGSVSGDRSKV